MRVGGTLGGGVYACRCVDKRVRVFVCTSVCGVGGCADRTQLNWVI
jgi:hypothetical protein